MQANTVTSQFIEFSRWKLLDEYWPRLRTCVESLSDKQVWWRPNEASNSAGNLILHLNGNVQQWLVASFSRQQDTRDRPAEFAAREGMSVAELLERLGATIGRASDVLARLTETELRATYHIQGYTVNGLHAVYQVGAHFRLHSGGLGYIPKRG